MEKLEEFSGDGYISNTFTRKVNYFSYWVLGRPQRQFFLDIKKTVDAFEDEILIRIMISIK